MEPARILVVDDSLTIRRALEFILKPRGYALEFAADGREALDRATSFGPDLVLLDYVLPDMRGPDVCSALEAIPATSQTPVILVSAKGASIRQAYQDAQNVVSYITKPFKPQVVHSVVDNALARGRAAAPGPAPAAAAVAAEATHDTSATEAAATQDNPLPELRVPTLDEAFSALLAQLEDAVTAETNLERPPVRSLARLAEPLRRAHERLRELGQHVEDGGVAPYRLRPDGSFANVSATLLETHRLLCEATLALAAAGAPGPELRRPPHAVIAVPADHPARESLSRLTEAHPNTLLLDRGFASLPWILHLTRPRVLIATPGSSLLDSALGRTSLEGLRRAVFAPENESLDGEPWSSFERLPRVEDVELALGADESPTADTSGAIGLEVVSL